MKDVKLGQLIFSIFLSGFFLVSLNGFANAKNKSSDILKVGKPLPNATLSAYGNMGVDLKDLRGKMKIIRYEKKRTWRRAGTKKGKMKGEKLR